MSRRPAIFLDRDGVINVNRPDHVKTWEEFEFLPRSIPALQQAAAAGWIVIVTTNQAAIHRGFVAEATVREIHARMQLSVERAGGCIHAIYYCPHTPEEKCTCRKPQPGMYLKAASQFGLDLGRSYVVGDTIADILAAQNIGARPILVRTGLGCQDELRLVENNHTGYVVAEDLQSAIEWIFQNEKLAAKTLR
jgi:D-glycero-D-manno-heptose 1,7-bisphosphate phosphatase